MSRTSILNSLHRTAGVPVEKPSTDGPWMQYGDPELAFATALRGAGGQCASLTDGQDLRDAIDAMPMRHEARRAISVGLDMNLGDSPEALSNEAFHYNDVDLLVAPGELAVAENAAVWINDKHLPLRALYFMVRDLVLVVEKDRLVHNLHEAYAKLDTTERPYGCFVAGPSKTADIEQTLVIGAHGPRSLTVLLVPGPTSR